MTGKTGDQDPSLTSEDVLELHCATRLCQAIFKQAMQEYVQDVCSSDPQGSSEGSSISYMTVKSYLSAESLPETTAERAIRVVGLLGEFVQGAHDYVRPCFPADWPTMDWVFEPCKRTVQAIAYDSAVDVDHDWSFQLFMQLEQAVNSFLELAAGSGAAQSDIQLIESSMQVLCSPAPSACAERNTVVA